MSIEEYITDKFSTYYREGDKFCLVAKNRDGEEFIGEGIYTGSGNWVKVNSLEKIFIPIFHTNNIPAGHYYDMKTTPMESSPI